MNEEQALPERNIFYVCFKLLADTTIDRFKRVEANTILTNFLLLLAFHFSALDFAIRMGVTIYVNILAYFINDFIDVEVDLAAVDKDYDKALFIKQNKRHAFALIICMSFSLLVFTLFYSKSVCFGVIMVLFVIFIYTDYFKTRAFLDVLGCFFWALALAWIAIPDFSPYAIKLIVLLGLFSMCTEMVQCVKDYEEDKKYGLRTTPIVIGIPRTFLFARIIYVLSTLYTLFVLQQWVGLLLLLPLLFRTGQEMPRYWMKLRLVYGFVWLVVMATTYFGI
ncbi:UbiA family prenyltransferase [Thermodesulfobacteriota bacterium]